MSTAIESLPEVPTHTATKASLAAILNVDEDVAQGLIALGRGLKLIEPCGAEKRADGRKGAHLYAVRVDIGERIADALRGKLTS